MKAALDRLSTEPVADVAASLTAQLGIEVSPEELDGWWGSVDAEDIAAMLLRPPPHILRRLRATPEELLEIARRYLLKAGEEHFKDRDWYEAVFDANVPHPAGMNLAHYPPDGSRNPTPEQVVAWATSYRAIEL